MNRSRVSSAVTALVLTACLPTGYYGEVKDRTPLSPLADYASWWAATEACSDRAGQFDAIEWFTATSIVQNGIVARGSWSEPHEIIIVRGYEDDETTVRHEMLHDLLRGDSDHSSALWDRCDLLLK